MEKVIIENGVAVDTDGGEIMSQKELVAAVAKEIDFSGNAAEFIHVANDCSGAGGSFKIGESIIAKSMDATLIAARKIENIALFTKKGTEPKPQDWIHILFVDNKYGNLKSTLIKTRSNSGFNLLVRAMNAVNESPIGVGFSMRFADATAEVEGKDGKKETAKYKYLTFERSESESPYRQLAINVREKLDAGEIQWPSFDM